MDDLCELPAVELADLLRARRLSARELLDACLRRIERADPALHALVTLAAERATEEAAALDERIVGVGPAGPLHGLPVAIKDLHETAGIRTTFGSTLYRDHVPERDTLHVARMRAAGAVVIGKSNTPEFGAGSQTHNRLHGATANPYDPARTCGGSSGGAAVALAAGMVPLADGSDMGGSLRNPASFCNVVGLRPSPGRVPQVPARDAWFDLSVPGPMARTAADAALLLGVLAGPDLRCPTALPAARVDGPLGRDLTGVRVAFGRDLGGLPFEREVLELHAAQRAVLAGLGCEVVDAEPDLRDADDVFRVLRGWGMARALGADADRGGSDVAPMVRENVAYGRTLTADDVARAQERRTALVARAGEFWQRHEFLVLPVSQVLPFGITQPWVREIEGEPMPDYLAWMRSCSLVTTLRAPVASVPVGFSRDGLPFGLQVVGRPGDDVGVLAFAHAVEHATGATRRRPP
ncbi:MAG: amidase [Pseudonocardiaceae bacterium]|nr:amidase [Pseudonocardiaceae bacterium]